MKTKKVLLVNYAGYWMTANSFIADSSLALLAAVLLKNKIDVEIVDFQNPDDIGKIMEYQKSPWPQAIVSSLNKNLQLDDTILEKYSLQREEGLREFEKEKTKWLLEKIKKENIKTVGFKLWIGNGLQGSISMAKEIKKQFPNVKVIAGGPGVQFAQEYFFEYTTVFDHVVLGEAEETIVPLIEGITEVPNVLIQNQHTKKHFIHDLNEIPTPVYSPQIYPKIDSFYKIRIIDDSRGCFNKCAFCSHSDFSGQSIRKKAPSRVVDEMEKFYKEDNIQFFRLSGSNPPWTFLVEVAKEIIRRKLPIYYSAFSSFNNTNKKDFPLLYRSGLRSILYGLESGDSEFLKRIHNKTNGTREHILETCHEAMENNIFLCLSLIYPSPSENTQTKNITLDLIKTIFEKNKNGSIFISPPLLSQGSLWWKDMEKYGFKLVENFDKKKYILSILDWDANFLLPRKAVKPLPYSVDGKSCTEIFYENHLFTKEIESFGITTNIDDTAYLLGLLSSESAHAFKKLATQNLILGGSQRLLSQTQNKITKEQEFHECSL